MRKLLRGIGVPIDLLVYTDVEFNEAIKIPYSLEHEIEKSGKILYMDLSKSELIRE